MKTTHALYNRFVTKIFKELATKFFYLAINSFPKTTIHLSTIGTCCEYLYTNRTHDSS